MNLIKNILFSIIILPGTVLHEAMHFIVALITNGKPVGFTVIPTFKDREIIFGEVLCTNIRWYNAILIGLAPLIIIPITIFLFMWGIYYIETNIFWALLSILLFLIFTYSAIPSRQDLKVATKSLPAIILTSTLYLLLKY